MRVPGWSGFLAPRLAHVLLLQLQQVVQPRLAIGIRATRVNDRENGHLQCAEEAMQLVDALVIQVERPVTQHQPLKVCDRHHALHSPKLPERPDPAQVLIKAVLKGEDEGQRKGAKNEVDRSCSQVDVVLVEPW